MTRSFLIDASHPASFWLDALYVAVFTINRLPTPGLREKSSYEILFAKVHDYKFLKPFRCACFPHLLATSVNKLSRRSIVVCFRAMPLIIRDIAVLILSQNVLY